MILAKPFVFPAVGTTPVGLFEHGPPLLNRESVAGHSFGAKVASIEAPQLWIEFPPFGLSLHIIGGIFLVGFPIDCTDTLAVLFFPFGIVLTSTPDIPMASPSAHFRCVFRIGRTCILLVCLLVFNDPVPICLVVFGQTFAAEVVSAVSLSTIPRKTFQGFGDVAA